MATHKKYKVTALPAGPWNAGDIYYLLVSDRVERWVVSSDGLTIKQESPMQTGDNISLLTNDSAFISGLAWGDITGVLSAQTDLQAALDALQAGIDALDSVTILKGSWDASVGTFPGGGAAQAGWSYIVSVGGTVDGVVFNVNDRIIAIIDNASIATFAANWFQADYTDQVLSVAGKTGVVSLVKADVGLGNVPDTDFTTAVGLNTAKVTNEVPVSSTGTVLDLSKTIGTLYNMASANTATTYTITGAVLNGYARVLINAASEPTVTGATKIKGSDFVISTNQYMTVWNNGTTVEYWFEDIAL